MIPKKYQSEHVISIFSETLTLLNRDDNSIENFDLMHRDILEINLTIPTIEMLLNAMIPNVHTNIIQIPFSDVTNFY